MLKVGAEYRFIEQMLHQNYHVSNKLILCWNDVNPGHLPLVFQGRSYYLLPKFNKRTVLKDNAFLNILSAVGTKANGAAVSVSQLVWIYAFFFIGDLCRGF